MIELLLISFFAMSAPSRTSHYTCTLDLALAANDGSASVVAGTVAASTSGITREPDSLSKPKKVATHYANLIGRGVANCKNESGFQFNLPAVMAITFSSDQEVPLKNLRATVNPVSVDHNVNKIFDQYTPHVELRNTPPLGQNLASDRSVVVRGLKNDVLIQVNLNLPENFNHPIKISKLDLKTE